ncbi:MULTISPECIES: SIR2 family protein [Acutalibacteraceae]|uniref:SIR2 family protein n=1 Tax=Acutalibacteraceae TaxID=3082771 RepID=UPI0013E8E57B|nr:MULTISPECIES: SIR2 family protein [Acutalibacteraceae]
MPDKIVIVTGAGFSAPAKLPIQNKIIDAMLAPEKRSILDIKAEPQSIKFLRAFIEVGLYLLYSYGDSYDIYHKSYINILEAKTRFEAINNFLGKWGEITTLKGTDAELATKEMHSLLFERPEYIVDLNDYFKNLEILKEQIRQKLVDIHLNVSLEDVFTSFDKAIILKEHNNKYTYLDMDSVRHSILRLFTYYFGKKTMEHSFKHPAYQRVISFVSQNLDNITIVSTNWDTLWEGYLNKSGINYNLCLNDKYYKFDSKKEERVSRDKSVKLIKLHGSINWFRCLDCGGLSIIEKQPYGKYLFDDSSSEECLICKKSSKGNSVLIQPEIITPTMIKSIDNQLYRNLWKSASFALMNADKIIFIGYSFPLADYEFRMLLQKNISENAEIDVVLHYTDNPQRIAKRDQHLKYLLPEERYLDVFKRNNPHFYYNGFENYFNRNI